MHSKETIVLWLFDEYILPRFLESVRYAAVIHPMMLAGVRNVERNRPPAT